MNTNFLHQVENSENNVLKQNYILVNNHSYLVSTIDFKFNDSRSGMPEYYETKIFSVGREVIYYNEPFFQRRFACIHDALHHHDNVLRALRNNTLRMKKGMFEFISDEESDKSILG